LGCSAAGMALAFVFELGLAQTLNRPKDVESVLHVPLFLYIPRLAGRAAKRVNGHLPAQPAQPAASQNGAGPAPFATEEETAVAPTGQGASTEETGVMAELRPFADALRDRLLNFFDVRQMTHKPKLVAITSCDDRAGVSSIALGLARS